MAIGGGLWRMTGALPISPLLTPPPLFPPLPASPLPSPRLPSPSLAVYLVPLTLQRSPLPPAVAYELIIGAKHWTAI